MNNQCLIALKVRLKRWFIFTDFKAAIFSLSCLVLLWVLRYLRTSLTWVLVGCPLRPGNNRLDSYFFFTNIFSKAASSLYTEYIPVRRVSGNKLESFVKSYKLIIVRKWWCFIQFITRQSLPIQFKLLPGLYLVQNSSDQNMWTNNNISMIESRIIYIGW